MVIDARLLFARESLYNAYHQGDWERVKQMNDFIDQLSMLKDHDSTEEKIEADT